jgi:hypothetical protein
VLEGAAAVLTQVLVPWGLLAAFGLGTGVLGTLTGAGGGFLIVPLLLLAYPAESTRVITSISLTLVFANALSGTIGYSQLRRIDYRKGMLFAAVGLPTAVLGALTAGLIPRGAFDFAFGVVLVGLALYLLLAIRPVGHEPRTPRLSVPAVASLSSVISFFSSAFGIGGGFLQVPMMTELLGYPIQIAAGTSQFMLVFTAAAGSLTHLAMGEFEIGIRRTIALGIGVLIGAQIGARLSRRVSPTWVKRALAVCLLLVGARLAVG